MEIQQLKETEIIGNPENPRRKIGDISGLVASIKAIGLVEPVVVRQMDLAGAHDKPLYIIVSGARRVAACRQLKLETIPCVIRLDESNEALASIAENTAREDLSVEDLAIAVNRLEGLSMSDEELSAALSISASDVGHARTLSKASKDAKKRLKDLEPKAVRQFTLEESAVVVKYSDDKSRSEQVAETLSYEPEQLPHLLAQFADEDARVSLLEDLRASRAGKIEVKGFNNYERPPKGSEPLHNLLTSDGKTMTAKRHEGCPNAGFLIAYTDHDWQRRNPSIVDYCTDWEASGHKLSDKPKQIWRSERASGSASKSEPASEEAKQERRRVIANNKLWGPATTYRGTWLIEFCQRKELDAKAKKWVLDELIIEPSRISSNYGIEDAPAGFEAAFVAVFALLVKSRETDLKQSTWRPHGGNADVFDRYMRMLKDQGYPVSEVEQNLILDGEKRVDADIDDDDFGDVA